MVRTPASTESGEGHQHRLKPNHMPRGGTASPSPIKSPLDPAGTRGSSLPSHRHRGQPHPDPWSFRCPSNNSQHCQEAPKGRRRPRAWAARPGCSARASRRWSGTGAGRRRSRWPEPEAARGSRAGSAHGERLDHLPPSGELDAASDPGGLQPRGRTRTGLRGLRTTQPMGPMIELRRAIKTPTRPPTTEKRQWRRRRYWARSTSGSCH
jgi:hypothetical protein